MAKVTIIGGHGKVALLATPLLKDAGHEVTSVIRNPDQTADVEKAGATAHVADVQKLDVDELADILEGQDAVVWSAGVGGGDPERTYAVDRDAAVRTMTAAAKAEVKRFIMVSWMGSVKNHGVPEDEDFFSYADAKVQADEHLISTDLDYLILGPSALTTEPGDGKISVVTFDEFTDKADGGQNKASSTSRENVAKAIVAAVDGHGHRNFIRFNDGDTSVAEALDNTEVDSRL